jgi:hypothetical protein
MERQEAVVACYGKTGLVPRLSLAAAMSRCSPTLYLGLSERTPRACFARSSVRYARPASTAFN